MCHATADAQTFPGEPYAQPAAPQATTRTTPHHANCRSPTPPLPQPRLGMPTTAAETLPSPPVASSKPQHAHRTPPEQTTPPCGRRTAAAPKMPRHAGHFGAIPAHCHSPTPLPCGFRAPKNSAAHPQPPPSSDVRMGDGGTAATVVRCHPETPGYTRRSPFFPLLPTHKHPDNAMACRHRMDNFPGRDTLSSVIS